MFRARAGIRWSTGRLAVFLARDFRLLAVVSVTLGVLLATPDQPQIVYVPVGAATAEVQTPQPALVATDGDAAPDDNWPASSTASEAEHLRRDPSWLNLTSPLLSRDLAMVNLWETIPRTPPRSLPSCDPATVLRRLANHGRLTTRFRLASTGILFRCSCWTGNTFCTTRFLIMSRHPCARRRLVLLAAFASLRCREAPLVPGCGRSTG